MASNPFDQFDAPAPAPGFTPIGQAAPGFANKGPLSDAELADARARAAKAVAETPYADQIAKATRDKAVADAALAQQNASGAAGAGLIPNSNVHGDDYLKNLPAGMVSVVKGVASGNVSLPTNALRVPYWQQVLQHTLNYDPSFNAADFNTRARTRADFATGKMGLNITALNTALGHAGQVEQDASQLGNYGGLVGTSIVNPIKNLFNRLSGDPVTTNFQNDVKAYGGEKSAVFAGGAGGEGERQDARNSVPLNASPDQQLGVLSHDAELFKSRLDALNDQYKRGMGHTADITDLLNPHAREVYQQLLAQTGATVPGATPPGAPPAAGGQSGPADPGPMPGGGGGMSIASGAIRQVPLTHVNSVIDQMVRQGASADDIGKALAPYGFSAPSDGQVKAAQAYLAKHPGYKGSFGGLTQTVDNTRLQQLAGSGVGAGIAGFGMGATAGALPAIAGGISALEGNGYAAGRDAFNVNQGLMQDAHPGATLAGNLLGGAASVGGLQAGAVKYGLGKLAAPAAEAAYGGLSGYNQDGLTGAAAGAVTAPLAGMFGRKVLAPAIRPITGAISRGASSIADRFGVSLPGPSPVAAPTSADATALSALQKAGIPNVQQSLTEAQQLGLPMTLADTNPGLRSLAGAAVRRSPVAAGVAEDALLPRARGQIDRLGAAVTRDLGPISNIPQTSADLTAQAQAAASPLYEAAYNAPGASSVKLDDLTQRPSMQAGMARAYNIAREEGRDPTSLGFDLDSEGNVTLNRVPSFQTLDYVKRGLDDTLEPHRNPITGKLALNEATRAINGTKNTLLSRIDAVNPDYAAARATYAGPVQARDALVRGQDAFSLSPDELSMQVQGQSPEHLAQMQTGFRSELMNRANNLRDASNPFDATLGSPNARARIDTLYPGNQGNSTLFRQRDLEGVLARTNNDILGNSKTAERAIADRAFEGSALPSMAMDAALAAHGAVPVASIARKLGQSKLSDMVSLGLGSRAVSKADALAPTLLNTKPSANLDTIQKLLSDSAAYRNYIYNLPSRRAAGMFGSTLGVAALPSQK